MVTTPPPYPVPPASTAGWTPPHAPALRPPRIAVTAALLLFLSALLSVPFGLALYGPDLDFGFTTDNVAYLVLGLLQPATLILVLGAVVVRHRGLAVAALSLAAVHLLGVFVMLVVQLVLEARSEFLLESGVQAAQLVVAVLAAVLGLVAIGAEDRTGVLSGPFWTALAFAGLGVIAQPLIGTVIIAIRYVGAVVNVNIVSLLMNLLLVLGLALLMIPRPQQSWLAAALLGIVAVMTLVSAVQVWGLQQHIGLQYAFSALLIAGAAVVAARIAIHSSRLAAPPIR